MSLFGTKQIAVLNVLPPPTYPDSLTGIAKSGETVMVCLNTSGHLANYQQYPGAYLIFADESDFWSILLKPNNLNCVLGEALTTADGMTYIAYEQADPRPPNSAVGIFQLDNARSQPTFYSYPLPKWVAPFFLDAWCRLSISDNPRKFLLIFQNLFFDMGLVLVDAGFKDFRTSRVPIIAPKGKSGTEVIHTNPKSIKLDQAGNYSILGEELESSHGYAFLASYDKEDKRIREPRIFYDRQRRYGASGMTQDNNGNIYACITMSDRFTDQKTVFRVIKFNADGSETTPGWPKEIAITDQFMEAKGIVANQDIVCVYGLKQTRTFIQSNDPFKNTWSEPLTSVPFAYSWKLDGSETTLKNVELDKDGKHWTAIQMLLQADVFYLAGITKFDPAKRRPQYVIIRKYSTLGVPM